MAISDLSLQDAAVCAMVEKRGAEWYMKGIDKPICEEILREVTSGLADTQWLSYTKIQRLLRERKRDIREEINPCLAAKREEREDKRAAEKLLKEYEEYKKRILGLTMEDRVRQVGYIRKDGKLVNSTTFPFICIGCLNEIPEGSFCIRSTMRGYADFMLPYELKYLCSECIAKDQQARKTPEKVALRRETFNAEEKERKRDKPQCLNCGGDLETLNEGVMYCKYCDKKYIVKRGKK